MTPQKAVSAVHSGRLVDCTKDQYSNIRSALLKYAATQIDGGQDIYAQIALMEIERLDKEFKIYENGEIWL